MKTSELFEAGATPSRQLLAYLKALNVSEEVQNALIAAMHNADVDPYAQSYAQAMTRAMDEFGMSHGLEAIKSQVLYMLINMQKWKGEEARQSKKILKKWASSR